MIVRKVSAPIAGLVVVAVLGGCGSGSQGEEADSSENTAQTYTVPSGTAMSLTLDRELSAESTAEGDAFKATVSSPVTDGDRVLIPEGSTVRGEVTAFQEATGDRPAIVKLDFSSIEVRGQSQPLAATLTSAEVKTEKELEGEAKKIGGGAAAGGLVGGIISGNAKGALLGAAAGAAAGTAIALGTRKTRAYLPAGTAMELRLDESLRVEF